MSAFRRSGLTEQDLSDWASYARQITPLPGRVLPPPPAVLPIVADPLPQPVRSLPLRPPPRPSPFVSIGDQPGGLDNASWNRFRAGKLPPARTLDLHGRTAQRAFQALQAFLHTAQADGVRCVEIITGRGSGEAGGVLRRELPLWLNLPGLRGLVLAAAHPHAANPGAVRVLLRRPR
ncbi:Smr/MutS family protein [Rhodovastum atsumiense]|uniref:Smr/MutS family protein n=1 Tax=Rhodovastum atsumiense TaxID=504468 RepID=UPI001EF00E8C|nr:Smr/MutS family protein [Rhodovastum atsumiense]